MIILKFQKICQSVSVFIFLYFYISLFNFSIGLKLYKLNKHYRVISPNKIYREPIRLKIAEKLLDFFYGRAHHINKLVVSRQFIRLIEHK